MLLYSKTWLVLISMISITNIADAQIIGGGDKDPIPVFATNNSGFIQNGIGGADNLVLFDVIPPPAKEPPELDEILPIPFTIIGNLSRLENGVEVSLGTFSGLSWSGPNDGLGTLIGCVLIEGPGNGEFYQINPLNANTVLIGTGPIEFNDLAVNPANGIMYGIANDIIMDKFGNLTFGPNTLWFDSDGDLIPDTPVPNEMSGGIIRTGFFCVGVMQTFATGLAFDSFGSMYIYDSMDEVIWQGSPGSIGLGNPQSACCSPALDTDLEPSQLRFGNGLTVAAGRNLIVASDVSQLPVVLGQTDRGTVISHFLIPDPDAPPPDPEPELNPAGYFVTQFFQNQFFASVAVGDLVGASADLGGLPQTFADSIIVNNGIPAKDAVLEAIVVSDDFRFCITSAPPNNFESPVDVTVVFTLGNPSALTMLGLEIESQSNTTNIEHTILVRNVNTNQFDEIGSASVTTNVDSIITVDLSQSIGTYLNPSNGTLVCRIRSATGGPSLFSPWQIKYDSIFAVSD